MALKTVLIDSPSGKSLGVRKGLDGELILVSESLRTLDSQWQNAAITTATTTTVIEVKPNESMMLTDLIIILSKKVASATVIVRFYDGTNTEILLTLDAATAPFNFAHAFQGGIKGWKDANFQIVTDQATTLAVLVGCVRIGTSLTLSYSEWDAER